MQLKHTFIEFKNQAVSEERKQLLKPLINYIKKQLVLRNETHLNFICTHNSRRSQLAQIWAKAMSVHFGVNEVFCYSGGTEVTSVFPEVLKSLKTNGFKINGNNSSDNPKLKIKFSHEQEDMECFSKKYNHESNPKANFAAILTCSQANESCPFIFGADLRIPIPYEDPKLFDGTLSQADKYLQRSNQIASEMYHVFSKI